ncbi:MAG: hypothetical protein ACYDAS_00355 [Patescibacteria group bacterium]
MGIEEEPYMVEVYESQAKVLAIIKAKIAAGVKLNPGEQMILEEVSREKALNT